MLKGKTIVVGVTGGIAIYKTLDLISRLNKENANIEVIMTDSAKEFINPITFQTMSNNPVHHKMFSDITNYDVEHISLAKKADLIVLAPATANTIGKIANGLADNLLTTVVMASKAKVLIAPAMNTQMYINPLVQENMKKLENMGYDFINPTSGLLACGDVGQGKMSEPIDILEKIKTYFHKKDLNGKKVIVTAGPTVEDIDPVRYITNRSSGKMGYNIAKKAANRGAEVILISGPSRLEAPEGVKLVNVRSTKDMFDALGEEFDDADILIKAAAPSDFKPKKRFKDKIKKEDDEETFIIEYVKNPDILAHYGNKKNKQVVIGFAAETNNLVSNAKKKIKKKNLDLIIANDVSKEGAGFDGDTNIVSIIDNNGKIEEYSLMAKSDLADIILDKAIDIAKLKS